jgi:aspartate aminotransferase
LVIGAYQRNNKPYVFDCVTSAKNKLINTNHEYLPITGDIEFNNLSKKLYFGKNTNMSAVQTLSGTGSLYLLAQLLGEIITENKTIYIPNPTWDNHFSVFHTSKLQLSTYDYLQKDRTWDFNFLYDNVKNIPDSNIILFHGCAHNPSGYDPKYAEWKDIIELCMKKNLLILIDMAYLGFATGDIISDSGILRIINNQNYPIFVCSSYAKNFGLYSERVGNLFFRGYNDLETNQINDILRSIIRKIYSNPPSYGSNIIKTILSNEYLENLWLSDLKDINIHYTSIRKELKNNMENKLNKEFSDIIEQKGMFWYSKLTQEQVEKMREDGIFMPLSGRISLAGLNKENINRFVTSYVNASK